MDETICQRNHGGVRQDNATIQHLRNQPLLVQSALAQDVDFALAFAIRHLEHLPHLRGWSKPGSSSTPIGKETCFFCLDHSQRSGWALPLWLQPSCHSGRMNNQKCSTLFQKPRGRTRIIQCIYVVGFMVSSWSQSVWMTCAVSWGRAFITQLSDVKRYISQLLRVQSVCIQI